MLHTERPPDTPKGGVRIPDASSIGADLLIHTASLGDIASAWRLLSSKSFITASLCRTGSAGETPLMASVRLGRPEHVALIMLHPGFDDSSVRTARQRRDLVLHASQDHPLERKPQVAWAVDVLLGIRKGKVIQDELALDPDMAVTRECHWFLPRPGEWVAPQSLAEMGIELPMEPALPESVLAGILKNEYTSFEYEIRGDAVLPDVARKLWYLMARRMQMPRDDPQRGVLDKHIRSIGWSLFFSGSSDNMILHSLVIELLASHIEDVSGDDVARNTSGVEQSTGLGNTTVTGWQDMATVLNNIWNKTGNWLME